MQLIDSLQQTEQRAKPVENMVIGIVADSRSELRNSSFEIAYGDFWFGCFFVSFS